MTYMIFFAFEVFAFLSSVGYNGQLCIPVSCACRYQLLWRRIFLYARFSFPIFFGVRQLAAIHGSILTAWGIAGIAGPVILALMKEATGSYSATLSLFSGMLALAFLISLLIHWQNETERKKWSVSAGNN